MANIEQQKNLLMNVKKYMETFLLMKKQNIKKTDIKIPSLNLS